MYGYNVKTKVQSSQWMGKLSPRPKKARQSRSNMKVMLIFFFYLKGIVHYEFVPRGETVNKEFYLNVLKRLREAMRRKRPEACTNNTWMLHHDNAPAHASLLIREFLTKHQTIAVPPAALLSRFGPCGLFLFPQVKILTKRSPISDGGSERRKFDKGPSRHPAKHVPGRVPELEKTLGAVCQEWRAVL